MSQTPASYEPYTPGRPGPEHEVQRSGSCRPSYGGAPDCLVVASVICVVIWAMSGGGYFWPIWVLLPTLMPVVLGTLGRRKN
ncbi:2TM domain-containing protein [Nocardioides antri]|uniref:2TM domain-containing protein n=1 Tax=Nocardioides antri TaxID=2607659 RepID=A0A5B1M7C6_9ACTN|nr:2TM domain-containing protein [Nocardioides antri]KAA1427929.1 2TM domain-containing protein [Nocardioides antri]